MQTPDRSSPVPRTDGDILAEFLRHGCQESFAILVQRHGGMVAAVCRSVLGNTSDAQDAAQAVFLTLAQKASSLTGYGSVAGWLHRVAWFVAARAAQAAAIRCRHEQEAARMKSEIIANPPELPAEKLHAALNELPEKYRVALLLHHIEGRTEEETAALIGCNLSATSVRLTRGRKLLRQRLAARGVTLSVGVLIALLAQHASAATPAAFVTATAKLAASVLAGNAATTSAAIAALSKGALNMMLWSKLKIAAAFALALFIVGGTGAYLALAKAPATPPAAALPAAAAPAQVAGKGIDAATLARATQRGTAMFKAPLWRSDNDSLLADVDSMLIVRMGQTPPITIGALDTATGKPLWEIPFRPGTLTTAGGPDAQLVDIIKSYPPPGAPVYAPSQGGELAVINLADRSTAWKIPYAEAIPLPTFAGKLLVTGARVNFQGVNGRPVPPPDVPMEVRAYDRLSGKPVWSWPIPQPSTGTVPFRSNVGPWASPAYGDGKVYFVLDQTPARDARDITSTAANVLALVALNAADGKPAWIKPLNDKDISAVTYADQLVLTTIGSGELVARDSKTGEIKWHTAISPDNDPAKSRFASLVNRNEGLSPLYVDGDMVLVNAAGPTDPPTETGQTATGGPTAGVLRSVNRSAGMAAFDLHTGKQRWFFPLLMPPGSFGAQGPNPVVQNYFPHVAIGKNQIVLSASGDYPGGAFAYLGLNRQSGELVWHFQTPYPSLVAIRGDIAYLPITRATGDIAAGLYAVSLEGLAASRPK